MLQTDNYEVEPEQFANIEKRQYYGGYAWFSKESGEFMLGVKEKDVISLENTR